jgi:hypothetical protein
VPCSTTKTRACPDPGWPITHPVIVQFGTSDQDSAGNQVFHGVPPQDHKELLVTPEETPGGLLALLCPSSDLLAAFKASVGVASPSGAFID